MSPDQKALVQTSWRALGPKADGVALIFYHRLFATTPATRTMFEHVDPASQVKKLVGALNTVVNGLYEPESLAPALTAMGKRHASYGVEDQHYDAVGEALLWTLDRVLGLEWTTELSLAWSKAYSTVADAMREAGRE